MQFDRLRAGNFLPTIEFCCNASWDSSRWSLDANLEKPLISKTAQAQTCVVMECFFRTFPLISSLDKFWNRHVGVKGNNCSSKRSVAVKSGFDIATKYSLCRFKARRVSQATLDKRHAAKAIILYESLISCVLTCPRPPIDQMSKFNQTTNNYIFIYSHIEHMYFKIVHTLLY